MNIQNVVIAVICLVSLIVLIYYIKCKHKISSFFFGSVIGLIALTLINKYGSFLENVPDLNMFNTIGSAVLGVPFVILIVIALNI
jgi:ABC-type methionine transport system permease subunit